MPAKVIIIGNKPELSIFCVLPVKVSCALAFYSSGIPYFIASRALAVRISGRELKREKARSTASQHSMLFCITPTKCNHNLDL